MGGFINFTCPYCNAQMVVWDRYAPANRNKVGKLTYWVFYAACKRGPMLPFLEFSLAANDRGRFLTTRFVPGFGRMKG